MPATPVIKLLKRFDKDPAMDVVMKAEVAFMPTGITIVAFDDAFVLLGNTRTQSPVSGYIGGFNRNAYDAARGLHVLGRISEKDHCDFLRWLDRKEEEASKHSALEQLKTLADSLGYKLVKEER